MKKISIIIAVYNIENYIRKCLDSVISLDGDDIEILIVDDGSSDNSLKICKEYQKKDKRIRIIHQENKGLSSSRNVGIDNAKGEYIWFIDGDDYLEENYYKLINKYLDKYDIICFDYNEVKNNNKRYIHDNKNYYSNDEKYILSFCVVWNKIIKRTILEDISFPEGYRCNDIYVIPTLIMKTKKIMFTSDSIYNYVYHDKSLSNSKRDMLNDHLYALSHIEKVFNGKYSTELETLYINNLLFYYLVDEVNNGQSHDYKKINKIIKNKYSKYYKNRFWNSNGIIKKIYVRLLYYNMFSIVKLITRYKFK